MTRPFLILLTLLVSALAAAPARAGEDQIVGLITGATVGSIVGNQFGHDGGRVATTAGGALAGGWIGNDIGQSLDNDRLSRQSARSSSSGAFPANANIRQTNYAPNYVAPDAPSPESIYDTDSGTYCRTFSEQVRVGNQVRETYGTACLEADGSWRAVQ